MLLKSQCFLQYLEMLKIYGYSTKVDKFSQIFSEFLEMKIDTGGRSWFWLNFFFVFEVNLKLCVKIVFSIYLLIAQGPLVS